MKFILTFLLSLLLPLIVLAADGEVVVLTADNFEKHISSHDQTLVEFYAPWCGHCKALAPEYDKAAEMLAGKQLIAKVDCTEHRDLCTTHGVKGFPTLKLFRKDGSVTEYDSARKAEAIVNWLVKQAQPAYSVFKSSEEVEKFKKDNESGLTVILVVPDESSSTFTEFKKIAQSLRNDYSFGIEVKPGATESVTLYRSFDEPVVPYTGAINSSALTDFLKSEGLPLVGEIGPENFQKYVERDAPLVWVFVDYSDEKQNAIPNQLASVAKEFRDKVIFAKLDGKRWGQHAKTFGLTSATPGLVVEDRKTRKNYVFPADKEITAESIKAHIEGYLNGSIEPTVRSEPIPEKNDGPVKVVVGKSFDSIVMDTTKDVFVEFYAPWCGHCKALAPKYEELGQHFAKNSNIVIAKIDGTENDTPVDIQGFPTLIFYPSNDKANPVKYNGNRSLEDMIEFINKHSTVKSDAPEDDKDEL